MKNLSAVPEPDLDQEMMTVKISPLIIIFQQILKMKLEFD